MPGQVVVLESLVRDRCIPAAGDVWGHISLIVCHLELPLGVNGSGTLAACISIAATARKLMFAHPTEASWSDDRPPQSWMAPARNLSHHATFVISMIGRITSALSEFLSLRSYSNQRRDSLTASGSSHSHSRGGEAKRGTRCLNGSSGLHEEVKEGTWGSAWVGCQHLGMETIDVQVFQLSSILLTCVVQLCHWSVGHVKTARIYEERVVQGLAPITCDFKHLNFGMTELFYRLMGSQVMTMPNPQAEVGRLLGLHAVSHLNGRLLPGCCHLGCINLAGVSEAALPTLLCSGCRRTRYCSVKCQRAAWLKGGHSTVCNV